MAFTKDDFKEIHYLVAALGENFFCVAAAALPIEDSAIRINLLWMGDDL